MNASCRAPFFANGPSTNDGHGFDSFSAVIDKQVAVPPARNGRVAQSKFTKSRSVSCVVRRPAQTARAPPRQTINRFRNAQVTLREEERPR